MPSIGETSMGAARIILAMRALAISGAIGSAAAEAVPPPLVRAQQVRQLSASEAARRLPVQLRGVVTYHHRFGDWNPLFVQDASGGIYVELSGGLAVRAGDLVEVEGVSEPGMFAPMVLPSSVRVVGRGPLPEPLPRTIHELLDGSADSQWVELAGVVRRVEAIDSSAATTGLYALTLASEGRSFRCIVHEPGGASPPPGLVDSRVRVRGAAGTLFTRKRQIVDVQVLTPGFASVRVVLPASRDPFDQPIHPSSRLFQFDPAGVSGQRVRIRGVVTAQGPAGTLYVQDESGGLRVDLDAPMSDVRPGDVLDAVGFPEQGQYSPSLGDATARRVERGPAPEPVPLDPEAALSGDYDALPVRIEGLLLDHSAERGGASLLLKTGDHSFQAVVARGFPPGLRNGSRVQVRGICLVQAGPDNRVHSFHIAVASAADVIVLERTAWWTLGRALWTAVFLGVLVLAGLVWNLMLQRHVSRALARVRVLSGLLPICAWCKRIRDDKGYWSQVETYVHKHSEADFTHGICPDCKASEITRLRRPGVPPGGS